MEQQQAGIDIFAVAEALDEAVDVGVPGVFTDDCVNVVGMRAPVLRAGAGMPKSSGDL